MVKKFTLARQGLWAEGYGEVHLVSVIKAEEADTERSECLLLNLEDTQSNLSVLF